MSVGWPGYECWGWVREQPSVSLGISGHPTLAKMHKCPRFSGNQTKTIVAIVDFTAMKHTKITAAGGIRLILSLHYKLDE